MSNQTHTETMSLIFTNYQVAQFRRLALAVAPAASSDPIRETINAVLVEVQDDTLRMTTTDSYVLVTATMNYATADVTGTAGSVLIPAKWLVKAAKTIGRTDQYVSLEIADNAVTLRTPTGLTETHTTAGEFPNYRGLIPTSPGYDLDTYWDHDTTAPRAWNPAKMAALCKMADSLARTDVAVTVTHHHPLKPWVLTTNSDGIDWHAVLMPVRIPA